MRLTTKGRYAVGSMLDLSLHQEEGPVRLRDISTRLDISCNYLEQLFGRLRRAGLVESSRGPGGGYLLARAPREISVADVIDAVHEGTDATRCGGRRNCMGSSPCLTHNLWEGLSKVINAFLGSVSLAQLCAGHWGRPAAGGSVPVALYRRGKGSNALAGKSLAGKSSDGPPYSLETS